MSLVHNCGSIIVVSECIIMSLSCDSNFMNQTKKRKTNLRTELNSKSHIQGCFLKFDTLVSDTAWHIQEFKLVGLRFFYVYIHFRLSLFVHARFYSFSIVRNHNWSYTCNFILCYPCLLLFSSVNKLCKA
jgi:hypothetical protein